MTFLYEKNDISQRNFYQQGKSTLIQTPIPLHDLDVFYLNEKENNNLNIFYDKGLLYQMLDIPYSPVEIEPTEYPIIVKPIYNLSGDAAKVKIIRSKESFEKAIYPGCLWQPYYEEQHYVYGFCVDHGKILHIMSGEVTNNMLSFDDYDFASPKIVDCTIKRNPPEYFVAFIKEYFQDFRGIIRAEFRTNGDEEILIDIGLRLNAFACLGDEGFVKNIECLYEYGTWPHEMDLNGYIVLAKSAGKLPVRIPILEMRKYNEREDVVKVINKFDITRGRNAKQSYSDDIVLALVAVHDLEVGIQIANELEDLYVSV